MSTTLLDSHSAVPNPINHTINVLRFMASSLFVFRITPFAIARVQRHGDRTKSGTRDWVAT